jgi:hypothetical protein
LTTKDQKTLRENQARTQSGTRFYRNCFFLRCSRPLCSSQPTTPSPPHHTPLKGTRRSRRGKPETTRPTPRCHGPQRPGNKKKGPVISGPNSVPNAYNPSDGPRRSRRTRHHVPPRRKTPDPGAVLTAATKKNPNYSLIFHP